MMSFWNAALIGGIAALLASASSAAAQASECEAMKESVDWIAASAVYAGCTTVEAERFEPSGETAEAIAIAVAGSPRCEKYQAELTKMVAACAAADLLNPSKVVAAYLEAIERGQRAEVIRYVVGTRADRAAKKTTAPSSSAR